MMSSERPRLSIVHGPTPLVRKDALDARLGVKLWIKRDDATGGAEAGNKVRKLEFLLGDALSRKANVVLTCGGLQSNHARATAIACAELGLACVLFLRATDRPTDPERPAARDDLPRAGNVLLDRLVGAEIRLISAADYAQRGAILESAALTLSRDGKRPYVIPEGGSNGLGSLGYVEAMREVRTQLDVGLGGGPLPFDHIVHACGSGGTAAGVALGAAKYRVATNVRAIAVCDSAAYFEKVIAGIILETRGHDPSLETQANLIVDDSAKGPAYGIMSPAQKELLVAIARTSGTLLDPVYTGKAMFGLAQAIDRGEIRKDARVLFLHTGGLPGLLAQGDDLNEQLGRRRRRPGVPRRGASARGRRSSVQARKWSRGGSCFTPVWPSSALISRRTRRDQPCSRRCSRSGAPVGSALPGAIPTQRPPLSGPSSDVPHAASRWALPLQ